MYVLSQCLQLSEEGRGVASIANMLTITRIHNSVAAAAAMRRQADTPTNYDYGANYSKDKCWTVTNEMWRELNKKKDNMMRQDEWFYKEKEEKAAIYDLVYEHDIDEVFVFRVVQLARDYASRRSAFGKILKSHALHVQTLARMEVILSINIKLKLHLHS